jgi:hypothetical protein
MAIFSPDSGAEFRRWIEEHPDGYFVNITGPKTGRLHRGDCPHMVFREPVDLVSRKKWVSEDRTELEQHAREQKIELTPCDTRKCRR